MKEDRAGKAKRAAEEREKLQCGHCGTMGHARNNCSTNPGVHDYCYQCEDHGHLASQCERHKTPAVWMAKLTERIMASMRSGKAMRGAHGEEKGKFIERTYYFPNGVKTWFTPADFTIRRDNEIKGMNVREPIERKLSAECAKTVSAEKDAAAADEAAKPEGTP